MPDFLSTWMFLPWLFIVAVAAVSLWLYFIERRKERDWRYSGKYWLGSLAPNVWIFKKEPHA